MAATLVNIAPPGHEIRFRLDALPGATGVDVEVASVSIRPAVVRESLGELAVTSSDDHKVITVPQGKRIAQLKLEGLEYRDGGTWFGLTSSSSEEGPRVVVSIEDPSAGWIPLYTAPQVPARDIRPAMFTGASFSNRVLRLPAQMSATKLRLSVVKNKFPEDFILLKMRLDRVIGWADLPPRNLELVGPDGQIVWAFPGELPPDAPPAEVDLRFALEAALNSALAVNQPLDVKFHLRGVAPGKVNVTVSNQRIVLLRSFPGILRTELQGDSKRLDLGDQLKGLPLAAEQPSSVTADLTVRHEGIRILETVSDQVPNSNGGIGGTVVVDEPVVRVLPPAGLSRLPIVRAGLIGRAPEQCELSVQLVDMSSGEAGAPLGPPGVVEVEASNSISTVWVDLPEIEDLPGPVGLSSRANRGRFFWVSATVPLIRLAVRDPDPGGRPLRLNGHKILDVVEMERHRPAESIWPAPFRSTPPVFESDLFLTVDLSDLTLRYRR